MGEKRQTSHVEEFLITYVDTPPSKRGRNGTPLPEVWRPPLPSEEDSRKGRGRRKLCREGT